MTICTVKLGVVFRSLLDYQAGRAKQAEPNFTNMTGRSPLELNREFNLMRSLRPRLRRAVHHGMISHSPTARQLSRDEWQRSIDIYLAAHGLHNCLYAAYLHFDKPHTHLHLTISRIDPRGNVVSDSQSYRKNVLASRLIEAELKLDGPNPKPREGRQLRVGGVRSERGRRRFERLVASSASSCPPLQGSLKVLDACFVSSLVSVACSLDDLEKRLLAEGIECQFTRISDSSKPTGWRLRQIGQAGTWLKGSTIDRELSLKKVIERINMSQQIDQDEDQNRDDAYSGDRER